MRAHQFVTESETTQYNISTPNEIAPEILQQLSQLISTGSEVEMSMVQRNLQKASSIGYALDNGRPVGVIVLKDPVPSYRQKVFQNAGVPELEQRYQLELGYVYVEPQYRGMVSARLLRLMNRSITSPIFATTRENNTTINKILEFGGYQLTGEPWSSDRGTYNILLWIKG